MKCPKCGRELSDGAKFCMYCGTKIELQNLSEKKNDQPKEDRKCPKCGRTASPGDRFCQWCGSPLTGADDTGEHYSYAQSDGSQETNAQSVEPQQTNAQSAEPQQTDAQSVEPQQTDAQSAEPQQTDAQNAGRQETNAQSAGPQQTNTQSAGPQQGGASYGNRAEGAGNGKPGVFEPFKKKLSVKMIGGICAAAAAVIVLIVVMVINAHTINLNKYLTVTYSGGNTKGSAQVEFDDSAFEKDCAKKIKINRKKLRSIGYGSYDLGDLAAGLLSYSKSGAAEALRSYCIDGELSESEGLSNGDKITYEWDTKDGIAEELFGVRLKHSDKTFTVKDLPELQKIDLFDGVTVGFSGTNGQGSAEIEVNNAYQNDFGIYYELDKSDELSIGDTVTVTAYSDSGDIDDALARQGYISDTTTKEFTVSELSTYVTSAADVPAETLDTMKKQTEDLITSDIAEDNEIQTLGKTYLGSYFLTAKSGDEDPQNMIALVYSVSVRVPAGDSGTQDFTYYTCGVFRNLLKSGDTIDFDLSDGELQYNDYHFETDGHWFDVDGYQTLDLLKNEVVNQNASEYNAEENGNS